MVAEVVGQIWICRWEGPWCGEEARDGYQLGVQPRGPGIYLSSVARYVAGIIRLGGEHDLCSGL